MGNLQRSIYILFLSMICAVQIACAPASGSDMSLSAEPSELGEYGPKDWKTGGATEFCTESSGAWTCTPSGGINPAACSGAVWLGSVFKLQPGNQVWNTFGTEVYSLNSGALTWHTSGVALQLTEYGADFIVTIQSGCSMLYMKESL